MNSTKPWPEWRYPAASSAWRLATVSINAWSISSGPQAPSVLVMLLWRFADPETMAPMAPQSSLVEGGPSSQAFSQHHPTSYTSRPYPSIYCRWRGMHNILLFIIVFGSVSIYLIRINREWILSVWLGGRYFDNEISVAVLSLSLSSSSSWLLLLCIYILSYCCKRFRSENNTTIDKVLAWRLLQPCTCRPTEVDLWPEVQPESGLCSLSTKWGCVNSSNPGWLSAVNIETISYRGFSK